MRPLQNAMKVVDTFLKETECLLSPLRDFSSQCPVVPTVETVGYFLPSLSGLHSNAFQSRRDDRQ